MHVHQVHQAAEHIVTVIPALQIRLYDVIKYPFAVKAVVFGVDGLLKEAGALSPLQSLYFTHDTLTAVEVIQQALYVAGKVVIGTIFTPATRILRVCQLSGRLKLMEEGDHPFPMAKEISCPSPVSINPVFPVLLISIIYT